jgi:myosin heavy subunit
MLYLLTTGMVQFANQEDHPVTARILPALENYDEHDIVKTDEETIELTKGKDCKVCHSTMLLGMLAPKKVLTQTVLAATMLQVTSAAAMENDAESNENKTYAGVYVMIFFTVIIAINLEKMMSYIGRKISPPQVRRRTRRPMIKEEQADSPMDVDQSNLGMMDESTDDEIRQLRKRLRIEKEEQDDLKVVIQVRNQALENLQEVVNEKTREAVGWKDFAERISTSLENHKAIKEENEEKIATMESQMNLLEENIEKLANDNTDLQKKIKFATGENKMKEGVIASAQRKLAQLQEQLKEEKKKHRDGQELFGAYAAPAPSTAAAAPMADVEKEEFKKRIEQLEAECRRFRELNGQYGREIQDLRGKLKAPPKIYVTKSGTCYHEASCNHLKHGAQDRPRAEYSRCRDCL